MDTAVLIVGAGPTGLMLANQLGRRMARVPVGETGRGVTPYPYILILGQDDNERLMGERLRDWGASPSPGGCWRRPTVRSCWS